MDLPYVRDNVARILGRTREGRGPGDAHRPQPARPGPDGRASAMEEANLSSLVDMALDMVPRPAQAAGDRGPVWTTARSKVRCVPTQLSQVFLNLLINAVQAIEARRRLRWDIRVATRKVGDEMVIEVGDDGCGISPEHRERLFDPFFTTKPVGEGTGLGLSITHGIVAGHGGRIEVDSRVGEGSRFRIILPLGNAAGAG